MNDDSVAAFRTLHAHFMEQSFNMLDVSRMATQQIH